MKKKLKKPAPKKRRVGKVPKSLAKAFAASSPELGPSENNLRLEGERETREPDVEALP